MENNNPSHSESSRTLAGSAVRTVRSLSADAIFDKTARELVEASSTEGSDVDSRTSDEEGHASIALLEKVNALEEENTLGDEKKSHDEDNDFDERLNQYLDSSEDNSSTEEEAEQEV